MARGFLGGIIIGGVFSILVAGIVSFMVPISTPPKIADTGPAKIDTGEPASVPAIIPEMDETQPVTEPVAVVEAPLQDSVEDVKIEAMIAPLAQPEAIQDIEAPAQMTESTAPDISADEPVLQNPLALAPMEPPAPDTVDIVTQPAPPVSTAPSVPPVEKVVVEEAPVAEPVEAPVAEPPAEVPEIKTVTVEPKETPVPTIQTRRAFETTGTAIPTGDTPTADDGGARVTINRLPTASSGGQTDAEAAPSIGARAITRYSQPFANTQEKPLMSILLIDQGSDLDGGEVGIAALRSFPYPISFAVDMTLADAAERMAIYRNEGFEVMAMVDLPEGAIASDAETTLAVAFSRMPEVVGVLEGTGAGLQPNRDVADQVTAILAQGGYGLVSQDKGLNTMPKLAVKEGVPAAPIFRDFDSKDQTPTVIRRFLDQAAFKAGIEGSVIMLGRMRPETISALLVWGLQDRASQVALAPISAVLLNAKGE